MPGKYKFDIATDDKQVVFMQAARILLDLGFKLIDIDSLRPWGFYLTVDESQAPDFINEFYGNTELKGINTNLLLRPKFLGIAPYKRLSWQYHHRRAEIWRCLAGEFELITSDTNEEDKVHAIDAGQVVNMPQGVRHRGAGLKGWALIAEIWQHTDPHNPSDEEDIVRLQDDFGRR